MYQFPQAVPLQPMPKNQRVMRYPSIPFYVRAMPFAITPFMIHPVLPGETMKSLLMQARIVTDPIVNPLIGWWTEHMWFYVKLSDLYEREDITKMLLDPAFDIGTFSVAVGTSDVPYQYFEGGTNMVNWLELCSRSIIDHYFRDEGETYSTSDGLINDTAATAPLYNVNGIRIAKLVGSNVLESAELSDTQEGTTVDPALVTINESGSSTHVIQASEIAAVMQQWQMAKLYNLTEMTMEDYLAAQGLSQFAEVAVHRPELLRHVREWQYPSNTIDPANGTPRSAVSWSIREKADKNRMFLEPGFIVGIQVTRPKMYLSGQDGSFVCGFNDYKAWMPSFLRQVDANVSMKEFTDAAGPLKDAVTDSDGYWVDLADVLTHGEQFIFPGNTVSSSGGWTVNLASVPNAALSNKTYPTLADIQALFIRGTGLEGKVGVTSDGIVNLGIASSPHNPIVNMTPRGGRNVGDSSGGVSG